MADKLNLVVPDDLNKKVKKMAVDQDVSVSAVVRGLLQLWADGEIPTPPSAKDEGKDMLSNRGLAGLIAK